MNQNNIDITLNIRNNTNYPQEINIMGSPVNLLDNSNATRQFLWNITPENIQNQNQINISLDYKGNNQITYTTYTAIFYNTVLGDVNTALNGIVSQINLLGIGNFFGYVELGQVYISTYNNDYEFNTLTLNTSTFAGQLNTTFTTNAGTGFDNVVRNIAVQSDGKIIVGGTFTSYNGNPCSLICRLNSDGTFDNTFSISGFSGFEVSTLQIQSDDKIIAGGIFTSFNANPCNYICRLNADGSFDATFNIGTGLNNPAEQIIIQPDGKIIVVGFFSSYNGNFCNCICRLNTDGTFDNTFNIGFGFSGGVADVVAIQSDGKIIVGGLFTSYNGNPCIGICRLNTDGTFDNTFNAGSSFNGQIIDIKTQSDGKIIVVGAFSSYNGNFCNGICRLNTDGTFDNTFNIGFGFSGVAATFIFQPNSKIIVGGSFSSYNSNVCNGICRLNSDGTFDNTFNVGFGFDLIVRTLIYNDNTVTCGGNFTSYDGTSTNYIAQLYTQVPF